MKIKKNHKDPRKSKKQKEGLFRLPYPAAPNCPIETVSGVKCRKPNVAHEKRPEARRKEKMEENKREIVGTGRKERKANPTEMEMEAGMEKKSEEN